MQLQSLLRLSLLAGTCLAAPSPSAAVASDAVAIQNSLAGIHQSMQALDSAVQALSTNPQTIQALGQACINVEQALALAQAQSAQPFAAVVSINDAIPLLTTVNAVSTSVRLTVMDIVLQQPLVAQLGLTANVVQVLQSQSVVVTSLGQAVIARFPPQAVVVAQQSFVSAVSAIQLGVVTLQGQGPVVVVAQNGQQVAGIPPHLAQLQQQEQQQQQALAVSPEACAAIGFVPANQAVAAAAVAEQAVVLNNGTANGTEVVEERRRRVRGIQVVKVAH